MAIKCVAKRKKSGGKRQTRRNILINRKLKHQEFRILDSLYSNKNVLEICGNNNWGYYIMLKNGGYELEHNYGTIGFAMKNYYYLLQIAHFLHQLMVRSDLFPKIQKKFILRKFNQLPGQVKIFLTAMAETTLEHFRTIKNFVRHRREIFRPDFL